MLSSKRLLVAAVAAVSCAAVDTRLESRGSTIQQGQRRQTDDSPGYWLTQFQDVLATMQETYWNGTYWPTTIQWEGAVINTFLAASDRSFYNIIATQGGTVSGANVSDASLQQDIQTYFPETEAYFTDEDTDQIFGAAYDDAQWVVLEWLEALRFIQEYDTGNASTYGADDIANFAHRAHIFYNIVQNQFNTSLCGGGLTWNPALAVYKNSVTNELFLDTSIGMYLYFPGDNNTDPYPSADYEADFGSLPALTPLQQHDPSLLQLAIDEYNWFTSQPFLDSQGLIIDGFHISDNQTTCDQPDTMIYSYNQGILLSGLRQLWEATGNTSYLTDGYGYISSTMNATQWPVKNTSEAGVWGGLGRYGVMEDYCDAPANCSQDNLIFKGIYFDHLDSFCTPLPTSEPSIPGVTVVASAQLASDHASNCAGYLEWVEYNAQAALSTVGNGNTTIGGWWAEEYVDPQSTTESRYNVPHHPGTDISNQPWLLSTSPWACRDGQHGCNPHGSHSISMRRHLLEMVKRDGEQRTVETQAAGLAVVRAASDMSLS